MYVLGGISSVLYVRIANCKAGIDRKIGLQIENEVVVADERLLREVELEMNCIRG
jgi:hypothetical protein